MRLVQVTQDVADVAMVQHLGGRREVRPGINLAQEDDCFRIQTALEAELRDGLLAETAVYTHARQHAEQTVIGLDEVRDFHVAGELIDHNTKLHIFFAILRNIPIFAVPKRNAAVVKW